MYHTQGSIFRTKYPQPITINVYQVCAHKPGCYPLPPSSRSMCMSLRDMMPMRFSV